MNTINHIILNLIDGTPAPPNTRTNDIPQEMTDRGTSQAHQVHIVTNMIIINLISNLLEGTTHTSQKDITKEMIALDGSTTNPMSRAIIQNNRELIEE